MYFGNTIVLFILTPCSLAFIPAITSLPGVIVKDGWDITNPEVHKRITEFLNGKKANVIMRYTP